MPSYSNEQDLRHFAALSPEESAASLARERSPRVKEELEAAIRAESDPVKRRALMELHARDFGGEVPAAASQSDLGAFLAGKPGGKEPAPVRELSLSEFLSSMPSAVAGKAAVQKRSIPAAVNDTVIEFANAAAGSVASAGEFVSPGNRVSKFIKEEIIRKGEESQSDEVKAEKARLATELEAAQGAGDEIKAVGGYVLRNPMQSLAQAGGSFVGPGTAIKGAQLAARGAGAAQRGVTMAGLYGGAGAGGAMAGGDAAGQAYELVRQAGGTEEQAVAAAHKASVIPAAVGAAGGVFGAERLFAGAARPASRVSGALRTAGAEGFQEGAEEGITNYEGRRAAVPFDPTIDPMKGTAGAAAQGAILGAATGGGVALLTRPGDEIRAQKVPEVGPMSRAANAGIEQQAQMADAGIVPAPSPEDVAAQEQEAKQAQKEAQAHADDEAQRIPIFSTLVADVRTALSEPGAMDAVRARFGDEGASQLLASLTQATNPKIPASVREKHLQAVEEAMFVLRSQRMPEAPPGIEGEQRKALEAPKPPLGIELDTAPTGTMRVDSAGIVAPETRADAISTQAAVDGQISLGKGVPRGAQRDVPAAPVEAPAVQPPEEVPAAMPTAAPEPAPAVAEPAPAAQAPVDLPPAPAQRMGPFETPEAAEIYISQQRRSGGTSMPRALPRRFPDGSYGVAAEGTAEFAAAQADAKERANVAAGIKPGDVLNKQGEPFKNKGAAIVAARKNGGNAVEVKGGWVVRPEPEAKQAITGEAIDKEWTAFAPESGTKGVPRADMPQIRAEHRGALVNFLNARGVTHESEVEIPADQLKPTQAEFSPAKVAKAREFTGGDRSILVSADGHVLDGHHQWVAKLDKGEPVKAIVLNAPIDQLLPMVKEFPSAAAADGATAPTAATVPAQAQAGAPAEGAGAARPTPTPNLQQQWAEAVRRGDTAAARDLNDRIVAQKKAKAEPAKDPAVTPPPAPAEPAPPPVAEPAAAAPAPKPKEAAPVSAAASPASASSAVIGDFGERLHGARKDYAALLKDSAELDARAEPLSKSWPEPDYQKLLDGGADPFIVGFIRAARDEVPTKPQTAWKLDGWVKSVALLRDVSSKLLSGEIDKGKVASELDSEKFWRLRASVGSRAELYQEFGHTRSLKGVTMAEHHYMQYRGEKNVRKWVIEQAAKATAFSNWPRELAVGNSREEVLAAFKERLSSLDLGAKAKGQPQFVIYGKRGQQGAWIGKKIGREYIDLKRLDDVKAARVFMAEKLDELESLLAKYKETPLERRPDNHPRVGDDHRNGAPVTPEVFAQTFGFRGVQFGNYVEQGRRQSDLNESFDALMDMAAVLGLPPRALSLNGRLGLAFGARGKGGKGAPAAHFERGNVVINLTKGGGPGSLAHEWWHAVDNYFARASVEESTDYVTAGATVDRLRPQMREAFKAVQTATHSPILRRRAAELDKRRGKPYWNTPHELSARAFESYVIAKLQDQGAANDYLANVVDEKVWNITEEARAEFFGREKAESYPYPGQAEMPAVRAAFDSFFQTVQTREDEAGNVAMFSRTVSFADALDLVLDGKQPESRSMQVAGPLPVLTALGMRDLPLSTTGDRLAKMHFDHGLTRAELKRLPELLANPVMVFASDTATDGSLVAVLDLWKNGQPVVAAIRPNYKLDRVDVNLLASAYPKNTTGPLGKWFNDGLLRYADKEKTRAWATSGGVQFPWLVQLRRGSGKNVIGPSDVVKSGPDTAAFSRTNEKAAGRAEHIRSLVDIITSRWAEAPPIQVVDSINDQAVPKAVLDEHRAQQSQGASGGTDGVYFDGRVILFADRLPGDAHVIRVLFHEALGHAGLRAVFGTRIKQELDRLARLNPQRVAAKAKQYGLDLREADDRLLAAEEVLAEMAEKTPELGWVKNAIAAIRSWLRKHVPGFANMKLSDAEIIRDFILPARRYIKDGVGASPEFADTVAIDAPAFSRLTDTLREATTKRGLSDLASDLFTSQKTFNWWHRSVGTQYHKASVSPEFKAVYDRTQDYLHDTTAFATDAAGAAPDLLPQLNTWRDLGRRIALKESDKEAVAKAVFTGTLTDKKVYSADELRSKFGLNDEQAKLYRQFRASVDRSLDILGAADVARLVGDGLPPAVKAMVAQGDTGRFKGLVLAHLQENESDQLELVRSKFERIEQLKSEGYAPLMRFGRYTVDVVDAAGERVFFGMFESQREANKAARDLAEPGVKVTQGIMSQEAFKQFQGVSPETLELFAEMAGVEKNELFQQYLKLARSNRDAIKRLIERKGIAGYSEDPSRVLAAFVTSNARAASGNLHMGEISRAVAAIPKQQGDVLDEAQRLKDYVQNPQEEAQAIRGLLFTQYIGGSVASAMVNMTQPLTMTYPFLAQYGGAVKAASRLVAGIKGAVSGVSDPKLKQALEIAEKEGIVSPQEIHQLQAEASRSTGNNPWVRKGLFLWGSLFSLAEQFNRRATFIAAFNTAVAEGMDNPFQFAADAVDQTQGVYNRANKPNWARGALGGTLFTFKQYSVSYMEFLKRLPPKERALALAVLMLAAGAQGLPGAEDIDDVIDTIAQFLGYDFNSKQQKARFLASIVGEGGAEFMLHGFSALPGFPLDVSARMSVGNLIPGTGMLLKSKTDKSNEVLEVAGPAGGMARDALKAIQTGDATVVLPLALRNIWKGLDMYQTGQYRDGAGRKVIDVDAADAAIKAVGFQPAEVAQASRTMSQNMQQVNLAKNVESEIAAQWAQGLADGDPEKVKAARERLADWNVKNPQSRIGITMPQIIRRVREIRMTREQRLQKAAPKEMRQGLAA